MIKDNIKFDNKYVLGSNSFAILVNEQQMYSHMFAKK